MIEFVEFLDHNYDAFTAPRTRKREFNKFLVLETIQDEQAVGRLFQCQSSIKFGFGASLETKVIAGTFAQVFFYNGTLLIDLHWVNTHVRTLIIKLSN